GRPVRGSDSLCIRSDRDRHLVEDLHTRFRALPAEQQQASPALLNGLGKLQVAVGDFTAAQEAFDRAAAVAPDARARAETHDNAYRAAREQGNYDAALDELRKALKCAPQRFAPFPLEDYEPQRILGAGGFGVTFLCKLKLSDANVAVKSIAADDLDRDVGTVLQEASALDQLAHPAIIRLRHCGYADAARTP